MRAALEDLARLRIKGRPRGIPSVCSAHPIVLRAALRHGRETGATVLIEATWTSFDRVMLTLTGLASLSAQLEQQARDYAVDSKTDRNFTTTVGLAATTWLLRLFTAVGLLIFFAATLSGILSWWVAAVLLIALPTALHRFTRPANQPRSERLTFLLTGLGLVCISLIFVAQLWR